MTTETMTLPEQIKHLTNQFATNMFKNGVESAVSTLCFISRNIGAQRPNLAEAYSNSDDDAEEYGCVLFFEVLGGKLSLARYVETICIHAAVQVAHENRAKASA